MTNLSNLTVSLTKHGAHKVAELIKAFPKGQILENLWDTYRNIKIDAAQTRKNLSCDENENMPDIWEDIRQKSELEIDNLVLISIIFSHHQLIETMISSSLGYLSGKVTRDQIITGKAYTNFACILEELGFSVVHTPEYITYDLRSLFYTDSDFPDFVSRILRLKLITAGWDEENNLIEECLIHDFHKVFSIPEEVFSNWIIGSIPEPGFYLTTTEEPGDENRPFAFLPGHNPQPGDPTKYTPSSEPRIITRLHNEIQNKLYKYLVTKYGREAVGTENPLSFGNIDIVVSIDDKTIFYEIKTRNSVRKCIREALPQLMEYSYWPDQERANELIIVSHNPPSNESRRYIKYLRETFNIPVHYQQFDLDKSILLD